MAKTQLKKLKIEIFRALKNVEVELGDHITVICGKNGTSKSSILGIAAQIFSFEKDYVKDTKLSFKEIAGDQFKSQYTHHFRISTKFDKPGSMAVGIELHDGYTDQDATAKLELMARDTSPRPVVRNNSTATGNKSRNFTHPVIFLSLKRLFPIADRKYFAIDFDYLQQHKQEFIGLTNELLNQSASLATGTKGTINSAVSHGDNYDHESVSAGEDNAGQIILALMSFRKLKDEYPDYKGGLLLIDEADAGLFPTAQINLLKILDRECRSLNLQVVMTSHSPTLIEHAYEQSQKYRRRYKTIYLSNTYGVVQVMHDWSWPQISADINTKTAALDSEISLPKINIYFEDNEAADFFSVLMLRQPTKKFLNPMLGVTMGCSNYLQLIDKNIPEFADKSIVCLDADAKEEASKRKTKKIVILPGELPPDQLIFQFLYNLPASHDFWKNKLQFTRHVLTNSASDLIRELAISGPTIDIKERISAYEGKKTPRDMFKIFYKGADFQALLKSNSPWKYWAEQNPALHNEFLTSFKLALHDVMTKGYSIDISKLAALDVKLKKA